MPRCGRIATEITIHSKEMPREARERAMHTLRVPASRHSTAIVNVHGLRSQGAS